MDEKVTWGDIYEDFRRRHPNLKNDVVDYRPYDYATIIIWLKFGRTMLYNYDTSRAVFYA